MSNPSNPNGANQYQLDPRQKLCWESYIDPRSGTFGNATQSAILAGYEPDYADQITTVDWFKGKVRKLNMLDKAEKVLEKTLTYSTEDPETGKVLTDVLRVQTDVAKFVNERLNKEEYSSRTEQTGKDGKDLIPDNNDEIKDLAKRLDALDNADTTRTKDIGSNGVDTDSVHKEV